MNTPNSLAPGKVDYVASFIKSVVGVAPCAGPLLAEIAGIVIPNQRVDRIAKFALVLEKGLRQIGEDQLRAKITDENCTELIEESLWQVVRSTTDERREYIASLLANGLTPEYISLVESRHLLKILGEINDIEVIWLRSYLVPTIGGDNEFREKHESVLKRVQAYIGCSEDVLDKSALQESYLEHLTRVGLLSTRYQVDSRSKQLRVSTWGDIETAGYQITALGRLLLRQIGFAHARLQRHTQGPPE